LGETTVRTFGAIHSSARALAAISKANVTIVLTRRSYIALRCWRMAKSRKPEARSRDAELASAIVENPDDADAYAVYGDWLESVGDPRGQLIALQRTQRTAKKAEAFLAAHETDFLGPLAAHRKAFVWANGFIRAALLPGDAAEVVEALFEHPSGRFVVELGFVPTDDMTETFAAVARAPRPTVRAFRLEDESIFDSGREPHPAHVDVGDLGALWRALPRLASFYIDISGFALGTIDAPCLASFGIGTDGLSTADARAIAQIAAPKLAALDVDVGEPDRGASATVDDLAPLLQRTDLPELRHLGIGCAHFADELVELLASSKLLPQLDELRLTGGALTDAGAAVLAKHRAAFRHLKTLDLDQNYLTEAGTQLVAKVAKQVSTDFQKQEEDGGHRYVGSWE
jgi:uncharacterized protein (TIGR02996 family)